MPIKDKAGTILTSTKDQEKQWTEHFREISNRPLPAQELEIRGPEYELDIKHRTTADSRNYICH
jgi:hypothetical protein